MRFTLFLCQSQNFLFSLSFPPADVGYDGIDPVVGFINNIVNIYFHEYFPRAVEVAQTLRDLNDTRNFIYTTHPWLVSLYLDCPPNLVLSGKKLICPSDEEVQVFVSAIKRGDITWHRCGIIVGLIDHLRACFFW